MLGLLVFGCSVLLLAQVQGETESRVVQLAQGYVRGYKERDFNVFAFYDIPYATVSKRYQAPTGPPEWRGTFEAVRRRVLCPQLPLYPTQNTIMMEDCLVTNVIVPNTEKRNLPVLITVHGGAFQQGAGADEMFRTLVQEKNIISVNFNYRIGVLGFLCLGTKDAPGNAGLKDQLALLRWVQQNIASFGGNPDDITINGCSAGSASVDILTLSNTTRGLFKRAISDSGAHLGVFAVQINPIENAKISARMLNFDNVNNLTALEEFYKTASIDLLTSRSFANNKDSGVLFSPCVERDLGEEAIITEAPYNILKRSDYVRYPTIYGFTDMEGTIRLSMFDNWRNAMNEKFSDFLPGDLKFESEEQKDRVAKGIKEFYFGNKPITEDTILEYVDYYTDVVFAYPMLRSVKTHAEAGNFTFYLHEYSFVDRNSWPVPFTNVTGANHCDQAMAVMDEDESNITDEYRNMKRIMRELWGNFITKGVPVVENTKLPLWPPTNGNRTPHLSLGPTVELKGTLLEARARFWDDIYEKYYHGPIPPTTDSASTLQSICLIYLLIMCYLLL
ncbi:esterase FE4 [Manduca sexta]|uniref:Carboxylic ester hydrolase n=1 Tax=Manduca sexta TaxID=7130 RepID=A0A977XKW9_MANSE|nr:esterase FE4 [Manduca sexta]UXP71945.1 esterase [Manduca sexta]